MHSMALYSQSKPNQITTMGSEPNLPIIEFHINNSKPGTSSWKSTLDSVRQALESYGCFVVSYKNTNISLELHESAFLVLKELFDLSLETKRKHTSEIPGFGFGNYPTMPLFEYFGIENGDTVEGVEKFSSLMWSHGHDKFCENLNSYCKVLLELDHKVKKMVTCSYGLEKYYEPLIESSFYMARLMRYRSPGANGREDDGLIPHRDKTFMTVIGTNEVKGLMIETRNGEWIDFEPSPGKFIVIAGEPLMAWTNGRIYCPLHKVSAKPGPIEKYSIGLFSFISGILQVPEELVDDQNPLKFKSFNNFEFLEYCKKGGPKMREAIQEYCGILTQISNQP